MKAIVICLSLGLLVGVSALPARADDCGDPDDCLGVPGNIAAATGLAGAFSALFMLWAMWHARQVRSAPVEQESDIPSWDPRAGGGLEGWLRGYSEWARAYAGAIRALGTHIGDDAAGLSESWEESWKELVKGSPRSGWEQLGTEVVEAIIAIGGEFVEGLGEVGGKGVEALGDYQESYAKGLESLADAVDEFKKGDIGGGIGELAEAGAEMVVNSVGSIVKLAGGAIAEVIEYEYELVEEIYEGLWEIGKTGIDELGKALGFWK